MKVRSGFVSNSSTSSFVLVGFEVDKTYNAEKFLDDLQIEYDTEAEDEDVLEDNINEAVCSLRKDKGICFLESSEDGAPKGKKIVGILIAETSSQDSYLGENDVLIQGLLEEIDALKEKLNAKNSPTSIYTGARCC